MGAGRGLTRQAHGLILLGLKDVEQGICEAGLLFGLGDG